eukprot:UN18200
MVVKSCLAMAWQKQQTSEVSFMEGHKIFANSSLDLWQVHLWN